MPSKLDRELTDLLTKLYNIQEEVGAQPKTSDEEKQKKAENAGTMGRGKKAEKKGMRFLELKSSVIDQLKTVHELLEEQEKRNTGKVSVASGNNPKDVIAAQATIREHIRSMHEEWTEMDTLYKNEARKKRSKFSESELEIQQTLVLRLQDEVEKVREVQQRGFMRSPGETVAVALNTKALAALQATDFSSTTSKANDWSGAGGGGGGPEAELTDQQRLQIEQIDKRDAEFDQDLDIIGQGIQDLSEIAALQGEEVKRQNVMLESVGKKIDNVNEHLGNVNSRMKETLDEVGRSADKLCVDIMCIALALGFAAVFYRIMKAS